MLAAIILIIDSPWHTSNYTRDEQQLNSYTTNNKRTKIKRNRIESNNQIIEIKRMQFILTIYLISILSLTLMTGTIHFIFLKNGAIENAIISGKYAVVITTLALTLCCFIIDIRRKSRESNLKLFKKNKKDEYYSDALNYAIISFIIFFSTSALINGTINARMIKERIEYDRVETIDYLALKDVVRNSEILYLGIAGGKYLFINNKNNYFIVDTSKIGLISIKHCAEPIKESTIIKSLANALWDDELLFFTLKTMLGIYLLGILYFLETRANQLKQDILNLNIEN
ncbi:MAG: hypothetical protein EOP45_02440 [Sphingobacteriaceae bacterium]|nr:MAG: hypothetical protein EOP45_02440 [Sphingobacteriaceae bacterium]